MDIFAWFTADVTPTLFSTLQFSANRQRTSIYRSANWYNEGATDAIQVTVDRSITIIGIVVYGDGPADYKVIVPLNVA